MKSKLKYLSLSLLVFVSVLAKCSANWWTPFSNCDPASGTTTDLTCNANNSLTYEQRASCALANDLCAAIQECRNVFKNHRWNCLVGRHLNAPTRESAYVQAITAVGLLYTSNRDYLLPFDCYLSEWNDQVVSYAKSLARDTFADTSTPRNRRERGDRMMRVHNFEVGMTVAKEWTDRRCSCNGPSDSCVIDSCWMIVDMIKVAEALKDKYDRALRVRFTRGNKLVPHYQGSGEISPDTLVYFDSSPDYCEPNSRLGLPGTASRECQPSSFGPNDCMLLCCGRGYHHDSQNGNFVCD